MPIRGGFLVKNPRDLISDGISEKCLGSLSQEISVIPKKSQKNPENQKNSEEIEKKIKIELKTKRKIIQASL